MTSQETVLADFPEAYRAKNVTGNETGHVRSAAVEPVIILGTDWDDAVLYLPETTKLKAALQAEIDVRAKAKADVDAAAKAVADAKAKTSADTKVLADAKADNEAEGRIHGSPLATFDPQAAARISADKDATIARLQAENDALKGKAF